MHRTVPGGQVSTSAPLDPVGPCSPVDPDTNNEGFTLAEVAQSPDVLLIPFGPAGGELITEDANDAVNTVIELLSCLLAVAAAKELLMFSMVVTSPPPNGK